MHSYPPWARATTRITQHAATEHASDHLHTYHHLATCVPHLSVLALAQHLCARDTASVARIFIETESISVQDSYKEPLPPQSAMQQHTTSQNTSETKP